MPQHDVESIDCFGRRRCARPGENPGDGERVVFSTFSDGSPDFTSPYRPGFRFLDAGDPLRLVAEQAYEERRKRLAEPWRKHRQHPVHDHASRQLTLDQLQAAAASAYEGMKQRLANAWRAK